MYILNCLGLGILFLGKCIWLLEFILFYVGMGSQQHGPMASPVRSQGKRPSSSDSQGETSQKARRDTHPN